MTPTHAATRLIWVAFFAGLMILPFATQAQTPVTASKAAASPDSREPNDLEINDGVLVWNSPAKSKTPHDNSASLKNVVELLRQQHPEANFILSPGLDQIEIEDLKLRNADVREKLQAICIASGGAVGWRDENQMPAARVDPITGLPVPIERRSPKPLFVFYSAGASGAAPKLQVEAFNIAGYLESVKARATSPDESNELADEAIQEVHTMVLQTVQQYRDVRDHLGRGKSSPLKMPSVDFHSGANLCIIIGEPEAVAVAAKVIGALPHAQRSVASSYQGDFSSAFGQFGRAATPEDLYIRPDAKGNAFGPASSMNVRVFQLKYALPGGVLDAVQAVLADSRSQVVPDDRTGSVVVTGTPTELDLVGRILKQLDVPARPQANEASSPPAANPRR